MENATVVLDMSSAANTSSAANWSVTSSGCPTEVTTRPRTRLCIYHALWLLINIIALIYAVVKRRALKHWLPLHWATLKRKMRERSVRFMWCLLNVLVFFITFCLVIGTLIFNTVNVSKSSYFWTKFLPEYNCVSLISVVHCYHTQITTILLMVFDFICVRILCNMRGRPAKLVYECAIGLIILLVPISLEFAVDIKILDFFPLQCCVLHWSDDVFTCRMYTALYMCLFEMPISALYITCCVYVDELGVNPAAFAPQQQGFPMIAQFGVQDTIIAQAA